MQGQTPLLPEVGAASSCEGLVGAFVAPFVSSPQRASTSDEPMGWWQGRKVVILAWCLVATWQSAASPLAVEAEQQAQDKKQDGSQGNPQKFVFPAYDAKKGQVPKASAPATADLLTVVSTTPVREDSLVRNMQRVLNSARKAENRVAKIQEDRRERVRL